MHRRHHQPRTGTTLRIRPTTKERDPRAIGGLLHEHIGWLSARSSEQSRYVKDLGQSRMIRLSAPFSRSGCSRSADHPCRSLHRWLERRLYRFLWGGGAHISFITSLEY